MGTAIEHPVPDRVKPSFVIFETGHSDTRWELRAYSTLSNPLAAFKGPTSMDRAGQGRGGGE